MSIKQGLTKLGCVLKLDSTTVLIKLSYIK